MKYFFVLGSNPTLSIAELSTVLNSGNNELRFFPPEILTMETLNEIKAQALLYKIGGTIKIGQVIGEINAKDKNKILAIVQKLLPEKPSGKFKFGFSNYGALDMNLKVLGMETKKFFMNKKISARWVTSREKALSSVVVEQNKLLDKGLEVVFFADKDNIFIGQTTAVQPFKELSWRDYGRPSRDDYAGMLPPKLAIMMINLAGLSRYGVETRILHVSTDVTNTTNIVILDPFCGSGTVLTEAALMGFSNLLGADISAKAIADTKKNIEWTRKNFSAKGGSAFGGQFPPRPEFGTEAIFNFQLFNKNVSELSSFVEKNSVDAVVTEPYLGPARGKVDIAKTKKELEDLYGRSLQEFYKVLKPGGRAVMVWPVFNSRNTQHVTHNILEVDIHGFKIINPIPENLRDNKFIYLTHRNTIIYGRPGQKVWREIVVLENLKTS